MLRARAFRGPALLLRFFYKSKTIKLIFYLRIINHVNIIIFFTKQRITCEKSDVCATVTIDADFDRQIHNNNNNMRAVKRVVYR